MSVLLLYGLGQNWFMLSKVETFLIELSFDVHKIDYPSKTSRLDECVEIVSNTLRDLDTQNNDIIIIG